MNEHVARRRREPTRAAEGQPRWRWTLAEFDRFIELGILTDDDKVELIGGELVPMAAKGVRHENLKFALAEWLETHLPKTLRVLSEPGWRPDRDSYCEPDLLIYPRRIKPFSAVAAKDVALLIEVADTTMKYDAETKATLYARLGVHEYWIINAATLETRVHLDPADTAYCTVKRLARNRLLTSNRVPEAAVRLKDLDLDDK